MQYIFFGTPKFAEIVLRKLVAGGMPPAALVCNPDRPAGRKKIFTSPPTKQFAVDGAPSVAVMQPEKLDERFESEILRLHPEFGVVAAYAKIIPAAVISLFPKGIIGVHPSLLPRHRGAAPIQSAILEGDAVTGTTLYLLDEKVDHGPVLGSRGLQVANRGYSELEESLAELSGELLLETLPRFARGEIKPQPQDELQATYTKKFSGEDGFIPEANLNRAMKGGDAELAAALARKIRALNPEPGTWTFKAEGGKRIKLLEAEVREGKLVLRKIQEEGKKPRSLDA